MIVAIMSGLVVVQAAPPSSQPDDIVVIGERMKHLRIVTKKDRKASVTRCVIKPSSGDLMLDVGVCDTYLACLPKVETASALETCMRPPLTELIKSWAERREAKAR